MIPINQDCKLIKETTQEIKLLVCGVTVTILNQITQNINCSIKEKTITIYDLNFNILNNIEKQQNKDKHRYLWIYRIYNFIKDTKRNTIHNEYLYNKLPNFKMKAYFYKKYKTKINPKKEYFVFGTDIDDLRPRYKGDGHPKRGFNFFINDDSVMIIKTLKGDFIIVQKHDFIQVGDFYYVKHQVCKLVEVADGEHDLIRINRGQNYTFWKYIIDDSINLSEKKSYTKEDLEPIFQLKIKENKLLFFNNNIQLKIWHPDFYIVKI